jgi:hypothetical protein
VVLRLQARRFRCLNPTCSRQVFDESLADAVRPFARRTERLGELQYQLALALGGEAGMRLAERLAMPSSAEGAINRSHPRRRHTRIRLIAATRPPEQNITMRMILERSL